MSNIRYLIRRRDTGQHVGYAPGHVHVWDDQSRAMFHVMNGRETSDAVFDNFQIEEYTLRPTVIQRIKWFLAWVTG